MDLYPFEETLASGAKEQEIIEKFDIGGISLIVRAAKNFKDVLIIASRDHYGEALKLIKEQNGCSTIEQRKAFASRAFNISSHYDTAIFNYFHDGSTPVLKQSILKSKTLRYGENPIKTEPSMAYWMMYLSNYMEKDLSYNNLLDIDAAVSLIGEFEETTFAILKTQ